MDENWLRPEVWEAAADDSLPDGVARINGMWVALDEFLSKRGLDDVTPWQRRLLAAMYSGASPSVPMRTGRREWMAAERTCRQMSASRCHRADECVLDTDCPFISGCLDAEAGF